jgi:endo-1,4-beta-D-glucanase Y
MLIVSIMAGHDDDAKQYFDGMLRYFRAHQSALTDGLMAWYQGEGCRDAQGDNSATNADLDIAYALLLADRQWGSCGSVNYAEHARWVIAAISQGELHREGRYMLLGDWVAPSNRRFYNGTRSSDFMPAHFRGFQHFMQQEWWVQVIDNGYWLLQTVQSRHSPDAGLLPDFIEMADSETPTPAAPDFLQGEYLGEYADIAALVPLRVGADFLLSGDMRAKRLLERMNTFVRTHSEDDPSQIRAGYALQGRAFAAGQSMAFTAPFGVSAMLDKSHQDWLNRMWEHVVAHPPEQSLQDSIRLLSMLLMSGNWWAPNRAADPCTKQSTRHTSVSR